MLDLVRGDASPGQGADSHFEGHGSMTKDNNEQVSFRHKPGQVDYTNARWAPVINCVVRFGDKILIVRRSQKLNFYPGYWNGISGFLDDERSLEEKVRDELREELGIQAGDIREIRRGEIFHCDEPVYKKTWIVHPVLVDVTTDKTRLNWEADNFRWVTSEETAHVKFLPGFEKVLEKLEFFLIK